MDCKKSSRAGVKIGKLFGSAGWQDFSDNHVPKPHNRVVDAGTINSFDYQSGRPSSLCWPLHKIHERETSGEIFFLSFLQEIQSILGRLKTSIWVTRVRIQSLTIARTRTNITRGLYTFYPLFEVPKTFFQGAFFLKFWPYVWLVFKSGIKSRAGYDGARTVYTGTPEQARLTRPRSALNFPNS